MSSVLFHCHSSPYGGYSSIDKITTKILQAGFFWPTIFKDVRNFVKTCDKYQRMRSISRCNEIPQKCILEIELFDVWEVDFMGLYFCKVLSDEKPIYRVVEPSPTKVNLNQLVIGKVLRKEGSRYFQIGPHSMRLPLHLSIKLDPKNLDTWADLAMYLTAANLFPSMSPQPQTPQSTRQTPPTSQ
jgi:Integrase zinc binding domain